MSADVLLCADEGDWFNLYAGNTSRDDLLFVPASVAHPAKQSIALTRRIFEEMEQRGWITAGSTLVDPFGGRGTAAALWCSRDSRNRALTIECEPHFVELQKKSRDHARRKLGRPLLWKVLRGDSRRCDGLIGGVGWLAALTSPPYGDAQTGGSPSASGALDKGVIARCGYRTEQHGASASQIGNLPDAALTSPPYGEGVIGKNPQSAEDLIARCPSLKGRNPEGAWFKALEAGYQGKSGANIDHLPEVGAVTSPPYENTPIAPQGADGGEWNRAYREGPEAFKKATRKAAREAGYSVVTSPPYEQSVTDQKPGIDMAKSKRLASGRKDEGASSQVIAGGYRAANADGNGAATSQIGAMTTPDSYYDNLPGIDSAQVIQLSVCQADTKSEPARSAGSPATADDVESVIAPIQTGSSTPRSETERSPRCPGGNRGRKSPGHETETGVVATAVGEVTDGSVFTTSPKSETDTFARTAEQPGRPSASPPTTSSRGRKAARPSSKISSPSATRATIGGILPSPDGTTALSAEQSTSPRAVPPAPVQSPAKPGLTPPSITAGSRSTGQPENYAEACLKVYAGLARAGVRFVVTVTKNPTRAGKLRRLDLLTKELLERAGYRIVAHRRAWLWMTQADADKKAGQAGLFEDVAGSERPVGRVSFFKRLGIAKGNVAAQWEDVIFCELAGPVVGSSAPLTSPPYVNALSDKRAPGEQKRRKAERLTRGEFATSRPDKFTTTNAPGHDAMWDAQYGTSPGQIGALPDPQDPAP